MLSDSAESIIFCSNNSEFAIRLGACDAGERLGRWSPLLQILISRHSGRRSIFRLLMDCALYAY
jgi:hypothetical protein